MPRGVPNRKTTSDSSPAPAAAEDASPPEGGEDSTESGKQATTAGATESAPTGGRGDTDGPPPAPQDPPLCPIHFPEGWPPGVTSAGCVDGQWERTLPAGE